jgi:hypothetical protein
MLNQGFILCLSFTMIVGITLFLFVNQKIKKLDKSVDTMIELIYGYSKELNTYKENITNLMEKSEYSGGSSNNLDVSSSKESQNVPEIYGNNPSKKIYIPGNGISTVVNESAFGVTLQRQDTISQSESDDRVIVSDDDNGYENEGDDDDEDDDGDYGIIEVKSEFVKSSLYNDVLDKITKHTEELVDTKPKIVKLDFEGTPSKSLFGERNIRSRSESESDSESDSESESEPRSESENEKIDYSKFSVNKLKSLIKENNYDGVRSVNKMKKQELIDVLEDIVNKNSTKINNEEESKYENVSESESMKASINNIFKTNEITSFDNDTSLERSFVEDKTSEESKIDVNKKITEDVMEEVIEP